MASRAEQLADQFDEVVREFIEAVESCPDERWNGAKRAGTWRRRRRSNEKSGDGLVEELLT